MKKVVILGSTGSIGENALRVIAALPDRLRVIGLAAQSNVDRLLEQARTFGVTCVSVADAAAAARCRELAPDAITVLAGEAGLVELAGLPEADIVLCAVVGMAGLRPVLAAVERGVDVALATKEVLVAAGEVVTAACARSGARLLPVDSEHNAIFQCLQGQGAPARLLLTASGGPFLNHPARQLASVTVAEALDHPRWEMGRKVTIDSATLMNKGLEIMEAHWLFGAPIDRIEVVIHPESIVHSMVQFEDGSILAQMGPPDMRYAIQYALTWPERCAGGLPMMNPVDIGPLHFACPDGARFPCLRLAMEAGRRGGTLPAALNAANEVAVERFLREDIRFDGIWKIVETVMGQHESVAHPALDAIFETDRWARSAAAAAQG